MKVVWVMVLLWCSVALASEYQVEKGDTLQALAKEFEVTVERLLWANPELKDQHDLVVGQVIHIPVGRTSRFFPQEYLLDSVPVLKWVWPVDGKITSGFGTRTLVVAGSNHHPGVDIAQKTGTPVKAARAGVVKVAGWDNTGFGNTVVIDHGDGWTTRYSHNSQLRVKAGQQVVDGEVIAEVGSTGFSTGPHLDFRMTYQGALVDPVRVFERSIRR
ncbi:peptidoglycan DD-metalloendopeptidase family protein [Deinococcus cellulosilyticus]|uniref:LysM domain-containing protein n=1 Tax=Deinococcus cellulosilyticus (strain DSM 18568 / NBRC 106333 / KACC 11606 / 5516J-15) TaxID=1223518 RepID=A0A511N2Q1_DEIC1|nr:M23 family metallopeptidase [Deinococcus cellulosilyticus]GEM46706.1 hypothetical protein DC3_23410 [Deinococcus cellulosilyticus NBRC 106333 = KACC 11606]